MDSGVDIDFSDLDVTDFEEFNRHPSLETKTTRLTTESEFDSESTIYIQCNDRFDGISISSDERAMALVDDSKSLYTVLDSTKEVKRMRLI
ncbi:Oidioi.mRNA.OKI2018_I69.XSR.g15285.t1.cds [Oikopleura dioica]|uniref:Oidioi.mRNA.OKI2018_I69.XSR.g15285.t1.cds n=1 Tax=Oikopleura dioica TaxID=34765 RepID=A0ABN7SHE1_OIKDI|nr:Oidioi.mRNA.OKI2018_I69.XSR.g15285.t1.cds [Oikopleura dioica]